MAVSPRIIDTLLFSGEGKEWRAMVWKKFRGDMGAFENTFYPLNDGIDPFGFIRAALDLYAKGSALEDYVEPITGKTIQVERSLTGEITPPNSFHTALFNQTVSGHQLLGLNCYLPDSLIPGHEAQMARAKLDDILGDL